MDDNCRKCGKRHRQWRAVARCVFPGARVVGDGPYAVIAVCKRPSLVFLCPTAERAAAVQHGCIPACGSRCRSAHGLRVLTKA
jgi:hypothetical protein